MSYDDWKTRVPDDHPEGRPEPEPAKLVCRDCGQHIDDGAHGTFTGTYCDQCWRWRAQLGLEFDPRHRHQIEVEQRKGAA